MSAEGGATTLQAEIQKNPIPYFFQVLNFSETQAPAIADIYKEVGVKSVALIYRGALHGIE
jgi:hypothetical protein